MYRRRRRRYWRKRRYFGRVGAVSKFSAPAAMNKLSNLQALPAHSEQEFVESWLEINRCSKTLYKAYRNKLAKPITLKTMAKWYNHAWDDKDKRTVRNEIKNNKFELQMIRYACMSPNFQKNLHGLVSQDDAAKYCLGAMCSAKSKGTALMILMAFSKLQWNVNGNIVPLTLNDIAQVGTNAANEVKDAYAGAVPMITP